MRHVVRAAFYAERVAGGVVDAVADAEREYAPPEPLDLRATLGFLRRGRGDPTQHTVEGSDAWREIWRAQRTPEGVASLRLRVVAGSPTARRS